jgi:hypothetical protein
MFSGKGYVDHPGTKPNDFMTRAFDRGQDDIRQTTARISTRFVMVLNGEKR